jgi:peptide/nickel transport system ATP-binding protein
VPEPLLEVRDLRVSFRVRRRTVVAVDGVSFAVNAGETLGVVGESGAGKSVSMLSLLRLIGDPNARISGTAHFAGRDLLSIPDTELRAVRGREIAMIFQDPMTALTPVYPIGWHIAEQIRAHERVSRGAARARAVELLREVGIPNPDLRADSFPHELSGGMRQRACIAMALACNPRLLIADEPTTALDVTTQAQILDLLRRLRQAHGTAIVIITHDMGVISEISDRVLVMYGGRAVEHGSRADVFRRPRHPYTWGLLDSVPRVTGPRVRRLSAIPGSPLGPLDAADGCVFAPRCRFRHEACAVAPPLASTAAPASTALVSTAAPASAGAGAGGHLDACWLPADSRAELRTRAATAAPPVATTGGEAR